MKTKNLVYSDNDKMWLKIQPKKDLTMYVGAGLIAFALAVNLVKVQAMRVGTIFDIQFAEISVIEVDHAKPAPAEQNNPTVYSAWMHYLKYREGCETIARPCPAGKLSVGYGHNIDAHGWKSVGDDLEDGVCTYTEASALLLSDVQKQYDEIVRLLPHLNKNQHLAITSLVLNCGLAKIMYSRGKSKNGLSSFWKECKKGGNPDFEVYTKYRTPRGKVCQSDNLINSRRFEEMIYYGQDKREFIVNGKKTSMSFKQRCEFYRQGLIKRDILPLKMSGKY